MHFTPNLIEIMSDVTLVLSRNALGTKGVELDIDFQKYYISIDGYYVDTGVWPPQPTPPTPPPNPDEKPANDKKMLIIILSSCGGILVLIILSVCISRCQKR